MDPFDLIGRYFHVLIVVVGLTGAWILSRRLRALVAKDPSLAPGARTLVLTIVVLVTVVPILQGVFQRLGGGGSDPSWWGRREPDNPYLVADFALHCAFTFVALWWAWCANGPARFAKYRAVFTGAGENDLLFKPAFLKWFITVVGIAFMVMRTVMLFGGSGRDRVH